MVGVKDVKASDRPIDEATQIAASIIDRWDRIDGVRVAIAVTVPKADGPNHGGLVLSGYDDDLRAAVDMLKHAAAIIEANGGRLRAIVVNREGVEYEIGAAPGAAR